MDSLLNKVILSHNSKTLIHHLDLHLRIPLVVTGNKKGESKDSPIISNSNSLKVSRDLIQDGSLYSTVTLFARFLGRSTSSPRSVPI